MGPQTGALSAVADAWQLGLPAAPQPQVHGAAPEGCYSTSCALSPLVPSP